MNDATSSLETRLGYNFKNPDLLLQALTHRSLGNDNNERLEFLGDSLLGLIITEQLYHLHPDANEGQLTRMRAQLVKGDTLAKIAKKMDLGTYLRLGTSELKSGGWRRNSILANSIEAIIGAIYLDNGIDCCKEFVLGLFNEQLKITSPENHNKDPKTRLQEYLQAHKILLPEYKVVNERGEIHDRTFTIECTIPGTSIKVQADGQSKRKAEQAAAIKALQLFEN